MPSPAGVFAGVRREARLGARRSPHCSEAEVRCTYLDANCITLRVRLSPDGRQEVEPLA